MTPSVASESGSVGRFASAAAADVNITAQYSHSHLGRRRMAIWVSDRIGSRRRRERRQVGQRGAIGRGQTSQRRKQAFAARVTCDTFEPRNWEGFGRQIFSLPSPGTPAPLSLLLARKIRARQTLRAINTTNTYHWYNNRILLGIPIIPAMVAFLDGRLTSDDGAGSGEPAARALSPPCSHAPGVAK
jgi:hypothetical protein